MLQPRETELRYLNTIIGRYIFRELFPPFLLNIVFLTFIFLMAKLLRIADMVVNYNVALATVGKIILYSMPSFLEFVLPMSVMITVLLTFLRMSGDNEIIAMRAGGMSPWGLLPPVILFSVIGCIATAAISMYAMPRGRAAVQRVTYAVLSENVNMGIKAGMFNNSFDGITLYVNQVDSRTKEMIDVFIEDQRKADITTTIVAPKGMMMQDTTSRSAYMRLFNGAINQVNQKDHSSQSIGFNTYDVRLDMGDGAAGKTRKGKNRKEMIFPELRAYVHQLSPRHPLYYPALLIYYQKLTVPVACIALGLLAVPLGIMSSGHRRRSVGLGLGLAFFLLYYVLLSTGKVFGEAGAFPPVIGMWLPNVVMGGIGLFLFYRIARGHEVLIPGFSWLLRAD